MTVDVGLPELVLGPAAGAGAFLVLAGGRFPFSPPRPFGRATVVRWLTLGVAAGFEEVVWRGVVLGRLLVVVGPFPALAASSVGFAAWHWPSFRGWCAVHIVTGAAFGSAFLAGGLMAAVLGHAFYNLLVDWAVHTERARVRSP